MKDYIADAIAFAMQASVKDKDSWREMQERLDGFVFGYDVKATGTLRAFQQTPFVYPGTGQRVTELEAVASGLPSSSVLLANHLWYWIGGQDSPSYAESVIRAARIEFTRSQFNNALFGIFASHVCPPASETARQTMAALPETIKVRPWSDGDAISRTPQPSDWFRETAAFDFDAWLAHGTDTESEHNKRKPSSVIDPHPCADQLLRALALVWLDEAVLAPENAITLFAEASEAIAAANFLSGWDAHKDMQREDGKLNAGKRHAENREAKNAAIDAYRRGQFRSKDHAAEQIAHNVVQYPFRTVRDWLKGA